MVADTLGSRVSKFIFLNKGKITEAFLVRTSASKAPSLRTLLGPMLTAAKAVRLIQVPHESGCGGQANFLCGRKKERGVWWGVSNRMQDTEAGPGRAAYRV